MFKLLFYIHMLKSSFIYKQLILHNVHIGHSLDNTLKSSSWFVYGYRESVFIINLVMYVITFRAASLLTKHLVGSFSPIWFIDLEKTVEPYVSFPAFYCGEISLTSYWINGLFSNTKAIFSSLWRLKRTFDFLWSYRQRKFKSIIKKHIFSRYTWPRSIFISGVQRSRIPALESLSSGFPGMGVVDSDTPSQLSPLSIPSNDESVKSVFFNNNLMSSLILNRKLYHVCLWFQKIRVFPRKVSFYSWFVKKFLKKKKSRKSAFKLFSGSKLRTFFHNSFKRYSIRKGSCSFANISDFSALTFLLGLEYNQDKGIKSWNVSFSSLTSFWVGYFRNFKILKKFKSASILSAYQKQPLKRRRYPKNFGKEKLFKNRLLPVHFFVRYRVRYEVLRKLARIKPKRFHSFFWHHFFNDFLAMYFLFSYKQLSNVRFRVFGFLLKNHFFRFVTQAIFGVFSSKKIAQPFSSKHLMPVSLYPKQKRKRAFFKKSSNSLSRKRKRRVYKKHLNPEPVFRKSLNFFTRKRKRRRFKRLKFKRRRLKRLKSKSIFKKTISLVVNNISFNRHLPIKFWKFLSEKNPSKSCIMSNNKPVFFQYGFSKNNPEILKLNWF